MDALITHPHLGSEWLSDVELVDTWPLSMTEVEMPEDLLAPRWWIRGKAWEEISGWNILDGGPYGEWLTMCVPLSLVRKLDPSCSPLTGGAPCQA